MDPATLQRRLRAVFVEELEEHRDTIESQLIDAEAGRAEADTITRLFRSAHTLKGAARSVGLSGVADLCHRAEQLMAAVRDDARVLDLERLGALATWLDALGEVRRTLLRDEDIEPSALAPALDALAASLARTDDAAAPVPVPTSAAPSTGTTPKAGSEAPTGVPPAGPSADATSPSVRLRAADLDALDVGVGRLVGARRRTRNHLRQIERLTAGVDAVRAAFVDATRSPHDGATARDADRRGFDRTEAAIERLDRTVHALSATLRADARRFERAVADVEAAVRRARLVPFAEACIGLERTLDDAARACGVRARFVLEGHDVALDRAVAARINAPLQHLVRNAVAHGIEAPEARTAAGRDPVGTISIAASTHGTRVRVVVTDDGRGIDIDRVLDRARDRGLDVPRGDRASAAFAMLFEPGFTTRDRVSAVAGRGVGLDVVRAEIEALQGTVELSSQRGEGTRFTIELPTTITTCKTLFVRACQHVWGLPANAVTRVVRLGDLDVSDDGQATIDGVTVPLIDAPGALDLPPGPRPREVVVLLQTAARTAGFVVNDVLDEDDVVIKPLGTRFEGVSLVDAATRRDDGSLAFLLHVPTVVQSAARVRPRESAARRSSPRTGHRLLVVDDSLTVRALVRSILEEAGYDVVVAVDGADALERVKRSPFDLVVSDFEMPRLDGIGLTRAIRADDHLADLPVILLTGRDDDDATRRGAEAGASAYLTKNTFDQTELIACIRRLLQPPTDAGHPDERGDDDDPGSRRG